LRKSKYWEDTLLLITYDEAGGFFDHKVPPKTVNPNPDAPPFPDDFEFTRLGVRVPGIVISPWLKAGVDTKLYDHSSVPRTAKDIFNLSADYLGDRAK